MDKLSNSLNPGGEGLNPKKSPESLDIFRDDGFNYLYKKTEKIVTAVYMITNFLASEEPIKWQLRNRAIVLIDRVLNLSTTALSDRSRIVREISADLFHLKSTFNIAYNSGFMSSVNYQIIDTEIESLTKSFVEYDSNQLSVNSDIFHKNFFDPQLDKRQVDATKNIKDTIKDIKYKRQDNVLYKDSVDSQQSKIKKTLRTFGSDTSKSSPVLTDRKSKIVEIVKQKGYVSVKDISTSITDCSEKTLQRELLALVDGGVLKKEGERRWSKYSLK